MIERQATRYVAATAGSIYDLVTDITRMGEWSPENQGGTWRDGAGGPKVGSRFTGRNRRKAAWMTTATVTEADPGRAFAFVIGKIHRPETSWRYTFVPSGIGCEVTETCQILRQPGPIGRLLTRLGTEVPWSQRPDDLKEGMEETLRRLAATVEHGTAAAAKQPRPARGQDLERRARFVDIAWSARAPNGVREHAARRAGGRSTKRRVQARCRRSRTLPVSDTDRSADVDGRDVPALDCWVAQAHATSNGV